MSSNTITTLNHKPSQNEIGTNGLSNIGANSFAIPFFPSMLLAPPNEAEIFKSPISTSVAPCDPADPVCNPEPPCRSS